MVPDIQKCGGTDGQNGRTDEWMHGRRQYYIPPTSLGDNISLAILKCVGPNSNSTVS